MNPFGSSGPFLLLPSWPVKASFGEVFSLRPRRDLSYPPEHPPLGGQYESEALLCDQCPQRYGPALSGGWTRRGCRHPNVPTTVSGCASIWISATNTATRSAPPRALGHFSVSWRPKTSPRSKDTKLLMPSGSCLADPWSQGQASRRKQPKAQRAAHPPQAAEARRSCLGQ